MVARTPPLPNTPTGHQPRAAGGARRLLRGNGNRLDAIVAELLAHESLDEREIYAAAGIERPAATSSPAPVPA
jgi:hypothetical protein